MFVLNNVVGSTVNGQVVGITDGVTGTVDPLHQLVHLIVELP